MKESQISFVFTCSALETNAFLNATTYVQKFCIAFFYLIKVISTFFKFLSKTSFEFEFDQESGYIITWNSQIIASLLSARLLNASFTWVYKSLFVMAQIWLDHSCSLLSTRDDKNRRVFFRKVDSSLLLLVLLLSLFYSGAVNVRYNLNIA